MTVIEKRLHEHFASIADDDDEPAPPPVSNENATAVRDPAPETLDQPFAKVNTVSDNSPAAAAGLKAGDLIRNFGYVNINNHDNLKKVAECVQGNEGVRPTGFAPRELCDRADATTAQHPRQDLEKQWGCSAPGTSADFNTTTQLGRQGDARMSYLALVTQQRVRLLADGESTS